MFGISMWELVLILLVALIFLGPRQLTETARVAGRLYRELQKLTSDVRSSIDWDSVSSPDSQHHESTLHQSEILRDFNRDKDLIPPPEEKSGPDFYAELLEKTAELEKTGEAGGSQTPEAGAPPAGDKEKIKEEIKA
ncbi:MAG: twin-arginine translocase TatA/TatE family subunit [Desulfomonile sp.]